MSGDSENCRPGPALAEQLLVDCNALANRLYEQSGAGSWGLEREQFAAALARSARKHFAGAPARVANAPLADYVGRLHLQDLALACACAEGQANAWDHFVATYRNYLRAAAAAILRCSATSPTACELADSLFADLYGLKEGQRPQRSLFRYFHGRSSLKTWLRAVLAQRHVDAIRAGRRFAVWEDGDAQEEQVLRSAQQRRTTEPISDPHRERYVALFTRTMEVALGLLDPRDKERLRLYYAEEQTLAEIGRRFGEHESSVSRNLERTRRELRSEVEQVLRKGSAAGDGLAAERGLTDEQIVLCFQYAAEDAPIDFDKLFVEPAKAAAKTERKER